MTSNGGITYTTNSYGTIHAQLGGLYQLNNTTTILTAVKELAQQGLDVKQKNIHEGLENVCCLTGLRGRWEQISTSPLTICDTGHNLHGLEYIIKQIQLQKYKNLHIVFGMVCDKDINGVLSIMPKEATYYFCKASVKRAMPAEELKAKAISNGLYGTAYSDVWDAYTSAKINATDDDFIYIGGSSFIVADFLAISSKSK
jgi:dihydrofolate synthase/folylpolyglutamate synthase